MMAEGYVPPASSSCSLGIESPKRISSSSSSFEPVKLCKDGLVPGGHKTLPMIKEQVQNIIAATEPTFLNITVNRITAEVGPRITSTDKLDAVVRTIFDMVTKDAVDFDEHSCSRHARCGETYADITLGLRGVLPTFDVDNDKPMTFTRVLLNVTQDTFEAACAKFTDALKDQDCDDSVVNALISLVSFIGHLYVRKLVAVRVLAQVVHDLVGVRDRQPHSVLVSCVCELMQVIGKTIDANKQGNILMTQFLARLSNLAASKKTDTQELIYSQEMRDAIKGVHEARFQQWPARVGTQVLVQYHVVSKDEAAKAWHKLHAAKALSPLDMKLEHPCSFDDDASHIKITAVISGRVVAVFSTKDSEAWNEAPLKERITELTSIHRERLMVFTPTSTLLTESAHAMGEHADV